MLCQWNIFLKICCFIKYQIFKFMTLWCFFFWAPLTVQRGMPSLPASFPSGKVPTGNRLSSPVHGGTKPPCSSAQRREQGPNYRSRARWGPRVTLSRQLRDRATHEQQRPRERGVPPACPLLRLRLLCLALARQVLVRLRGEPRASWVLRSRSRLAVEACHPPALQLGITVSDGQHSLPAELEPPGRRAGRVRSTLLTKRKRKKQYSLHLKRLQASFQ